MLTAIKAQSARLSIVLAIVSDPAVYEGAARALRRVAAAAESAAEVCEAIASHARARS